MIFKIFAVIGIVSIITILRIAEYKAYDFDYTKIPCGIVSLGKFICYVYLIWFWLGYIM